LNKRILVILGHPSSGSYCAAIASAYKEGAQACGNDVRFIAVGNLFFDPVLHNGYHVIQELEPDLKEAQAHIKWAQHIVFVYPIWWGTMPALLKGFIDRIFLPGFAFNYREGSLLWDGLLTGRSAHLLVTMDAPPWFFRWVYRMPGHNQMKRAVLGFSGIKSVKITSLGPVKGATQEKRRRWLDQVREYGRDA